MSSIYADRNTIQNNIRLDKILVVKSLATYYTGYHKTCSIINFVFIGTVCNFLCQKPLIFYMSVKIQLRFSPFSCLISLHAPLRANRWTSAVVSLKYFANSRCSVNLTFNLILPSFTVHNAFIGSYRVNIFCHE